MKDLNGRCALVTGASAGLGQHVALALAREKMNLVLAARSVEGLERVAEQARALGVQALVVPTDVSDALQCASLVRQSLERFSAVDVLVNNAGVEAFHPFHLLDPAEIQRTLTVNLTAAVMLTRLVMPGMVAARRGHVVNMASTAGKQGPAFGAVYAASKAGMIAFSQSLRAEYHGTGISSSAVCPGFARDGGIYEAIRERTGRDCPWWVGSTDATSVARAVVRAIRRDKPDVIVNSPPLRPIFTLCAAWPRLGEWLARKATFRFLKRAAVTNS